MHGIFFQGTILQVTGLNQFRICQLDQGYPDSDDCDFYPGFLVQNPARVSLMDRQVEKMRFAFSFLLQVLFCCHFVQSLCLSLPLFVSESEIRLSDKENKAGYTAQDAPSMRTFHL